MTNQAKLRWGILAAARIAKQFAAGVQDSETGILHAVGSRSLEKAQAFAAEFEMPAAHGSYEDLLADPDVDAVYIATPHPWHCEWGVKTARAGKHVLCEKPLGMNLPEAMLLEQLNQVQACSISLDGWIGGYYEFRDVLDLQPAHQFPDGQLLRPDSVEG